VAITIVVTKTETMVSQLATWPVHRSCPTGTSDLKGIARLSPTQYRRV